MENYRSFTILQTVAAIPTAKTRLDDIVYSELRQELGTHDMVEIITENRELIMEKVTLQVMKKRVSMVLK